jgi:uncharacterized phiE125 gp8 family phage protein
MRWVEPEVITPASAEVLALITARTQTRREADETDNDADLQDFIDSAVAYVEAYTGTKLAPQTLKLRAWGFEDDTFPLPVAPVSSLTSITYVDTDGLTQTLDPSAYVTALYGLSPTVSRAYNQIWPAHRCGLGNVTFTVVCGYPAGGVPKPINQALRLMIGDWDSNRESTDQGRVQAIEMVAVDSLLTNFRRSHI